MNYDPTSVLGCHIVEEKSRWLIGKEKLDYDLGDEVPEIAVDPGSGVVSMVNNKSVEREFIVSIRGKAAEGVNGKKGVKLAYGATTGEDGETMPCITFIALVPKNTIYDICRLPSPDLETLDLDSDIQDAQRHPSPETAVRDCHQHLGFPLEGGPFMCTQTAGGMFTHHFAGNYHAVDFRCPTGTPVLAIADGAVLEASDDNTTSGIHVSCLFKWNSIMLQLEDGSVAEYVHIAHKSSRVQKGDIVKKGDVLCMSGAVGFCPEPHLHFQLLESPDPKAVSLPCRFGASSFQPSCGKHFTSEGEQDSLDTTPLLKVIKRLEERNEGIEKELVELRQSVTANERKIEDTGNRISRKVDEAVEIGGVERNLMEQKTQQMLEHERASTTEGLLRLQNTVIDMFRREMEEVKACMLGRVSNAAEDTSRVAKELLQTKEELTALVANSSTKVTVKVSEDISAVRLEVHEVTKLAANEAQARDTSLRLLKNAMTQAHDTLDSKMKKQAAQQHAENTSTMQHCRSLQCMTEDINATQNTMQLSLGEVDKKIKDLEDSLVAKINNAHHQLVQVADASNTVEEGCKAAVLAEEKARTIAIQEQAAVLKEVFGNLVEDTKVSLASRMEQVSRTNTERLSRMEADVTGELAKVRQVVSHETTERDSSIKAVKKSVVQVEDDIAAVGNKAQVLKTTLEKQLMETNEAAKRDAADLDKAIKLLDCGLHNEMHTLKKCTTEALYDASEKANRSAVELEKKCNTKAESAVRTAEERSQKQTRDQALDFTMQVNHLSNMVDDKVKKVYDMCEKTTTVVDSLKNSCKNDNELMQKCFLEEMSAHGVRQGAEAAALKKEVQEVRGKVTDWYSLWSLQETSRMRMMPLSEKIELLLATPALNAIKQLCLPAAAIPKPVPSTPFRPVQRASPYNANTSLGLAVKGEYGRRGAEVTTVHPGGPADMAGLRKGDKILYINGNKINTNADIDATLLASTTDLHVTRLPLGSETPLTSEIPTSPVSPS